MELTEEQSQVCDSTLHWIEFKLKYRDYDPHSNPEKQFMTIGGYAGTGKTFLISGIRKVFKEMFKHLNVAFVTFTGKASSVLRSKLEENNAFFKDDFVGTIHSLIYKPVYEFNQELQRMVIVRWEKKPDLYDIFDLIIIDEASMVSKSIWKDLTSFGIPIVAVGDHGQLPPVSSNGDSFSLMSHVDYKLDKIHRQAACSPIISLSAFVRRNGFIPSNKAFSGEVFKLSWNSNQCQNIWDNIVFDDSVIVLCGFNKSRVMLNYVIRSRLDFKDKEPYPGERLVCLKNNPYSKIMNGQIGTLMWVMPHMRDFRRMTIQIDGMDEPYEGLVNMSCFDQVNYDIMFDKEKFKKEKRVKVLKGTGFDNIDFFDFGYTISVHKSQGSEWPKVVLFEQRSRYWDNDFYKRWLYTAITRAKEKLFVISDYY